MKDPSPLSENPDYPIKNSLNTLMMMASISKAEFLKDYLTRCVYGDLTKVDLSGRSVLFFACQSGNVEKVSIILKEAKNTLSDINFSDFINT